MLSYILNRVGSTVIVMLLVSVFVFMLLYLAPGDPAAVLAGDNATPEQVAKLRASLGLNDSALVQFWRWISQVLQGNLGVSIFSNESVLDLMAQRAGATLSLAIATMSIAVPLAITLGVIAAHKAGTMTDRILMLFSVVGFSVPAFVVGYFLVWLFAIKFQIAPVQGYVPISEGIGAWLKHLALPAITLGLTYTALIARITRATMIEVLSEDFIRTARAKGMPMIAILLRHALRNAGVPIITVIGIGVALLIGGVVVTETVFNIPGVGRLVVDAIARRDYPIIQGVILVFSGIYVLLNLATDLSYTLIDPRIRY
ncbi:MAG: ABC transporter permease [Burkholderiales bacterium]|nr:MAG: ABC transporter permease [Burkholderiales bacterium]